MTGRGRQRRHGFVFLAVIAAVGLAAVVAVSLVKLAVFDQAALETEAWQLQSRWLAESALDRAAARLAADPKYRGETWHVSADDWKKLDGGEARIEVRPAADRPGRYLVRAVADYPDDPLHHARETRELVVDVPEGK
jgi:hypothetical protein